MASRPIASDRRDLTESVDLKYDPVRWSRERKSILVRGIQSQSGFAQPHPNSSPSPKMLARSSLVTARAALRQAPANPAMRRGLHVDSQFLISSRLIRFISLNRNAFRACADPSR